jgi:Tfp pilus assembly major pilin PilA
MQNNRSGFALIDALVIVLVISILVVIAFPQYKKTVERERAAEILSFVDTLNQSAKAYFLSGSTDEVGLSDIGTDLSGGQFSGDKYYTKNASYMFSCSGGNRCVLEASRERCFTKGTLTPDDCDKQNMWTVERVWINGELIGSRCVSQFTKVGKMICKELVDKGFDFEAGEL